MCRGAATSWQLESKEMWRRGVGGFCKCSIFIGTFRLVSVLWPVGGGGEQKEQQTEEQSEIVDKLSRVVAKVEVGAKYLYIYIYIYI